MVGYGCRFSPNSEDATNWDDKLRFGTSNLEELNSLNREIYSEKSAKELEHQAWSKLWYPKAYYT
jgi:hypothetical protein